MSNNSLPTVPVKATLAKLPCERMLAEEQLTVADLLQTFCDSTTKEADIVHMQSNRDMIHIDGFFFPTDWFTLEDSVDSE